MATPVGSITFPPALSPDASIALVAHTALCCSLPLLRCQQRTERGTHLADAPKKIIKGKLPPQLANLGGYQAPLTGSITRGAVSAPANSAATSKRERESGDAGAGLSEQEKAERRRREEARKRVQARTAAAFGLQ